MEDIKVIADKTEDLLHLNKIEKYAVSVSESERKEISWDNGKFSLFRTVISNSIAIRGFKDGKTGSAAGTDVSDDGLDLLVSDLVMSIDSSLPDKDHDIAEKQENKKFHRGTSEENISLLFKRLSELEKDIRKFFPQIIITNIVGTHTKFHSIYLNTNDTNFEKEAGYYDFGIEFSASDGNVSTGLNYVDVSTVDLDKPFIEMGNIKKELADTVCALKRTNINNNFSGTVIFTPSCFAEFLYMIASSFLTDSVILDGSSLWLNKIGEIIADERLTLSLKVADPRIVDSDEWTGDGYLSEDIDVIKKGRLMTHLIGLYTANKTKRPVTKNADFSVVIEAGNTPLEEMIKNIKEGLVVGSFSGGTPGANGEFSGVAKNSFYIKDGEIKGSVLETMINGNLENLLRNLVSLSCEIQTRGAYVLPYASFSNVFVSSK